MSLIGDALELMNEAHKRARVIRAVVHHWEDREIYGQTPQRWQTVLERKLPQSSSVVSFSHTMVQILIILPGFSIQLSASGGSSRDGTGVSKMVTLAPRS